VAHGDKARARTIAIDFPVDDPTEGARHALPINGLDTRTGISRPGRVARIKGCSGFFGAAKDRDGRPSSNPRLPADRSWQRDPGLQTHSRTVAAGIQRPVIRKQPFVSDKTGVMSSSVCIWNHVWVGRTSSVPLAGDIVSTRTLGVRQYVMWGADSGVLLKKLWASGHGYLIEKRIEQAQDMSDRTDLSLSEIAFAVGFSHQSYLARHFRHIVGTTPPSFGGRYAWLRGTWEPSIRRYNPVASSSVAAPFGVGH
jgi:AraC-like DNA-binding protein